MAPDYDSFPDPYALAGYVAHAAPNLGVTITGVISASDNSNSGSSYYLTNLSTSFGVVQAPVGSISTPIIPGSQSFTINVQVVYSIT